MAYELFQNKATKFTSPQLTIRNGRIAFNADAGDILAGVGMHFAHLLWDADAFKLAIRPITKKDDNAYSVSIPRGKRGGTVASKAFLNYIQWQAKDPIVVSAYWNERERLLEAVLPKENVGKGEKGPEVRRRTKTRL